MSCKLPNLLHCVSPSNTASPSGRPTSPLCKREAGPQRVAPPLAVLPPPPVPCRTPHFDSLLMGQCGFTHRAPPQCLFLTQKPPTTPNYLYGGHIQWEVTLTLSLVSAMDGEGSDAHQMAESAHPRTWPAPFRPPQAQLHHRGTEWQAGPPRPLLWGCGDHCSVRVGPPRGAPCATRRALA